MTRKQKKQLFRIIVSSILLISVNMIPTGGVWKFLIYLIPYLIIGYDILKKRGIMICVHLINGLPGETTDMMMENVIRLNSLEPFSIKLHLLHILKGTPLLNLYERGDFKAFELFDYVKLICDQLEYIRPETVIQRLTGDGQKDSLVAPLWSMKKFVVLDEIDKELEKRKSFQGIRL